MKIETKLVPITWLPGMTHGYACGYVGVPEGHPWYKKDYDDIDVDVHGGLTWSDDHVGNDAPDGLWWVGFDTAHYNDNTCNCDEAYCEHEVESLKRQALEAVNE
jgi:hypothetical protein